MPNHDTVDLRSDTVTRPCAAMRQAMASAEVGDDVFGEDPAVNALQARAAELSGMESALFMPSGTMANLVAFLSQSRPGDSVILSEGAHPFHYERANLAAVAGLLPRTVADPLGKMTAVQVAGMVVRGEDPHCSPTTLVSIENTTNRGGGACYTPEEAGAIAAVCREKGLRLHCDGARIFNAALAVGVKVSDYGACCDTLSFCLSKGLGAPAGSLLCGSAETLQRALGYRKMLGGGMRQAGVLAAAGLHALDEHVEDLAEDHRRARLFREGLEPRGVRFPLPSPTNIVYVEAANAAEARARLEARGIAVMATGTDRLRVVFHRDISDVGLQRAIEAFTDILGE